MEIRPDATPGSAAAALIAAAWADETLATVAADAAQAAVPDAAPGAAAPPARDAAPKPLAARPAAVPNAAAGASDAVSPAADPSAPVTAAPVDRDGAPEAVMLPVQVSSLQGQAVWRSDLPRAPERMPPQRERRRRRAFADGDPDADADAQGDDDAQAEIDGADPAPPQLQPPAPRRAAPDERCARLTAWLKDAGQAEALNELERGRRVLLVTARPARQASADLVVLLLRVDAQGGGRVRSYRARGRRAQAGAGAWQGWRIHRDIDAEGLPRLVPARRAVPPAGATLALRLAPRRLAPPLADAQTSWLDLLDVQRVVHDLAEQWSALLLWAPSGLPAPA